MLRSTARISIALSLLTWALGCNRGSRSEPPPAPVATMLEPSKVANAAEARRYVIEANGTTDIDMPAPKEHIKASTSTSAGYIEVDFRNLANSRGELKVDFTSLKTRTFEDPDKNQSQTAHSHNWLEVGDQVNDAMRGANRWAVFAIRSIDGLSGQELSKVPAVRDGNDDVRTVRMVAHGEFLAHGHKVNKDARLEVKFYSPVGAPAEANPTSISIKSSEPFRVTLAEHEVKPRDAFGKFAQNSLGLLGTKVAETADISVTFRATPAP